MMKKLFLFSLLLLTPFFLLAHDEEDDLQEPKFQRILQGRDYPAVKEFLYVNEGEDLKQKNQDLNISGDVRAVWANVHEWKRGVSLRGGNAVDKDGVPISNNDFGSQFNFRLDYVTEDAWARAHIRFNNAMGTGRFPERRTALSCNGGGEDKNVNLRQAYIGYKVCADGVQRFDVEVGRRKLFQVLDSYVQFLSRFDGIYFHYTRDMPRWELDYKLLFGVVDNRTNHYWGGTQISLLNLFNSGLDLKYSFVHWKNNGQNRFGIHNPPGWRFLNSQWTANYHVSPKIFGTPINVYGALVYNHAAEKLKDIPDLTLPDDENPRLPDFHAGTIRINSRKNIAWYAGVLFGEVLKAGDMAMNLNYQVVQAQSVPECDMGGIGRGNIDNLDFTADREGNVNFRGWHFSFLYGLTDNISVETTWESSSADDPRIGGTHEYSIFSVEMIFAF